MFRKLCRIHAYNILIFPLQEHHDIIDLTAFNTDGFDVSGRNVWIHDCRVWCQDDTIAVKGSSENMLFERITASGIGSMYIILHTVKNF